jgi:hypothetical protein
MSPKSMFRSYGGVWMRVQEEDAGASNPRGHPVWYSKECGRVARNGGV